MTAEGKARSPNSNFTGHRLRAFFGRTKGLTRNGHLLAWDPRISSFLAVCLKTPSFLAANPALKPVLLPTLTEERVSGGFPTSIPDTGCTTEIRAVAYACRPSSVGRCHISPFFPCRSWLPICVWWSGTHLFGLVPSRDLCIQLGASIRP